MTASSDSEVTTTSLRFKMMSVTSSVTPAIVSNSWSDSSKRTVVMAAPGIDDRSVRRSELPSVWPKPGSSGPTANCWRLSDLLTEGFDGGALHEEHVCGDLSGVYGVRERVRVERCGD